MSSESLEVLLHLGGVGGLFCGVCFFFAFLARRYKASSIQLFGTLLYQVCVTTHTLGALVVGGCVVYVFADQSPQFLYHTGYFALALIGSFSLLRLLLHGVEGLARR